MSAPAPTIQANPGLIAWLRRYGVDHEVHEHAEAFTATSTAYAEGVSPQTFAKVVGVVTDDGRNALLVVEAPDHVDLRKARRALSAHDVRLLAEAELEALTPGCAAGAVPAVGQLFGLPMFVDHAVMDDDEVSFNAGSHRISVRVDRSDWERAAGIHYADLAEEADPRPAWSRS